MTEGLKFGPLKLDALHVAVDMQRLFGEVTEWHCASLADVLDRVGAIAEHAPARTVFTRFRTPRKLEDAGGQWRHYYKRWQSVLGEALAPEMFDLMPQLAAFSGASHTVDKMTYSAFGSHAFHDLLGTLRPSALVLTGVETDVCVLATMLDAVDHGYRTVLVEDAVTSASESGHQAIIEVARERFGEQIEVIDTETLLKAWRP